MLNNSSMPITGGILVIPDFTYCSDNNIGWMGIASLSAWIEQNREYIG